MNLMDVFKKKIHKLSVEFKGKLKYENKKYK